MSCWMKNGKLLSNRREEFRLTVKRGQEYTDMLSMKQQDSGIDQESMLRQRMGRRRAESA